MKRILLATAIVGFSATALLAASPKADLNGDGQVTKDEFTSIAIENFRNADVNGDNFLSEDEANAMKAARRDARADASFDKVDANGDGVLTREEVEAAGNQRQEKHSERRDARKTEMLERFDTNVDGELSDIEREAARAEMKDKFGGGRGQRKGGKRADRPKPDTNGDGLISFEEHAAVTELLFSRLDANGDGVLTQGEGKKRRGKKGKKRRGF